MMLQKLINRIVGIESKLKYVGFFYGYVVENNDPEKKDRIKIKLEQFYGEKYVTNWAIPGVMYAGSNYGASFVPEIGDRVLVSFVNFDSNSPVYTSSFWDKDIDGNEQKSPAQKPTEKIIKTKSGHIIKLDDDKDNGIVEIFHRNGTRYLVDKDGCYIEDASNNTSIVSKKISLGSKNGSKEPVVLGDTMVNLLNDILSWLEKHSHPQSSPPLQVPALNTIKEKVQTILSEVASVD